MHAILTRAASKLEQNNIARFTEERFHRMFGRWAAGELIKEHWDVVHPWSSVSEETLQVLNDKPTLKILMRGSSHILTQARLLQEEEIRTGEIQEHPSQWIIEREQREYQMADAILTLSTFAQNTFIDEGVNPEKLCLLPLGANLHAFRPSSEVIHARCQNILSGEPLRVLYVGALSFRKGISDLLEVIKLYKDRSQGRRLAFKIIGPSSPEVANLLSEIRQYAELLPKMPQEELPGAYAQGDLFIFPTIEDGYAVVLAQAQACALPILTTTNCAGPDLIRNEESGWILPIRSPQSFVDRLLWCDTHREELAAMVRRIYDHFQPRDWDNVAADFESICLERIKGRAEKVVLNGK